MFRQFRPHLVDDAVCGEVILVEGPVQADRGDVARADEGADAGALLDTKDITAWVRGRIFLPEAP